MPKTCRKFPTWALSVLLLAPLLVLSVRYIDIPVANFVKDHLYLNLRWSRMTSDLPDLLLQMVLLITASSVVLYQVRRLRGVFDSLTRLARLLTWATPASYLVKYLLKCVFGRVNTRWWLQDPSLYGFHWFQMRQGCDGFPSGHMIVVVTILAAAWRLYPRIRPWSLLLGLSLGVALIATNYHFVSDVVAGAYVGLVIEAVLFRLLFREPRAAKI